MSLESVAIWSALAFALWMAITLLFGPGRMPRSAIAAIVSWLAARAVLTGLSLLIAWLELHLRG